MLDEVSGAYGGSCVVGGASTITGNCSIMYPSTMNQETSTTSSLVDTLHHSQYQQTGGSLLDHPLTPTKFRQKTSTSVQTNGMGLESSTSQYSGYGTLHQHQHHRESQPLQQPHIHHMSHGANAAKSSSTTTLHQQHSASHPYHLYRQQSTCSANFSPVPAPLHPHQQHQSTTTCDLIGNTNSNVIKSTTTVNSAATASTLAGSCCSVNGAVQIHQGLGAGAACESAANRTQHTGVQTNNTTTTTTTARGIGTAASGGGGIGGGAMSMSAASVSATTILPECQREGGTHCCSSGKSRVRHRWHKCPELHKAMDGVTYIADQTRKEEESTRVSIRNFFKL